jgi:hypothetical protein
MIQKMVLKPLWIERYDFKDDNGQQVQMGKIFVVGDYVNDDNKVGTPVMSLACPFELLNELRQFGWDVEVEMDVEIRQGGKQKAGLFVVAVNLKDPPKKAGADTQRKSAA